MNVSRETFLLLRSLHMHLEKLSGKEHGNRFHKFLRIF